MNRLAAATLCAFSLPQLASADNGSFNLYRDSVLDTSMRIYIATFNSDEGSDYNFENCTVAAKLFQDQPGVRTRFWCEPDGNEG